MKTILTAALAALVIAITLSSPADARRTRHQKPVTDASGNNATSCTVASHKTGAKAIVGCAHASKFQALVDALETEGATVTDMGGWRRGRCSSSSQHPCNKALDVCQLGYGVVRSKCNLPNRTRQNQIARNVGLYSGGEWCRPDTGHFQVDKSAEGCGKREPWPRTLAATSDRLTEQ